MTIAEMYPKYFTDLVRFVRSMSGNAEQAEDVAQETFMRAMKASEDLSSLPAHKVRAWLYICAKRVFIDQYRREKRRPDETMPDFFEQDLSAVVVDDFLAALDANDRHIFTLRHFAGLTSDEIGARIGMPPATVRTRLYKSVRTLRKLYEGMQEG